MEKKVHELTELKETLMDWAKAECCKGVQEVDGKEMGELVDMIKDLAEAEHHCMEAMYYKKLNEQLEEENGENGEGRYGYNSRRYSSGRFAPIGRGHRMGYMPEPIMNEMFDMNPEYARFGYSGSSQNGNRNGPSGSSSSDSSSSMGYHIPDTRWGKAYIDYQTSRRHYTATNSPADKAEMEAHAGEHMGDTIASIREIWKTSDPALKKRFKADLTALMNELTV